MSDPVVAPYESCIACFKGDVTTTVALYGDPSFHASALFTWGVPEADAVQIVDQAPEGDVDTDFVPANLDGGLLRVYRVCADCAENAGMEVGSAPQPTYVYCEDGTRRPLS